MDYQFLEKQIRENNAEELDNYVQSFHTWQEEMRKKDEELLLHLKTEQPTNGDQCLDDDNPRIKKEKADIHKEKGNDFVKKGDWKAALQEYTESIKLYPDNGIYYGNRSYCYQQLQDWKAAECDCNRALELKPDYVKVALRRANIRKKMGNIHGAAKDYNLVLILDPKNSVAIEEYEKLYPELKKNLAEVGVDLPEFVDMNPSKSEQDGGNLLHKKGKPKPQKSKPKTENINSKNISSSNSKESLNRNNNYSIINPIKFKAPHLRSKLPLRRMQIVDVYSNTDEELSI